jgi:hypothetical protein
VTDLCGDSQPSILVQVINTDREEECHQDPEARPDESLPNRDQALLAMENPEVESQEAQNEYQKGYHQPDAHHQYGSNIGPICFFVASMKSARFM